MASELEIRKALRKMGELHRDALRPDSRRRIVRAARSAFEAGGRAPRRLWTEFVPQALAAASILGFLALPQLLMDRSGRTEEIRPPVTDLQVTTVDGQVVLTWSNGNEPRRVVRATSRRDLTHVSQLPGEVVTGHRWVDSSKDSPDLVYYIVE